MRSCWVQFVWLSAGQCRLFLRQCRSPSLLHHPLSAYSAWAKRYLPPWPTSTGHLTEDGCGLLVAALPKIRGLSNWRLRDA